MANAVQPKFKEAILQAFLASVDVKAILIDTADYTYSSAHDFLDDVAAGAREEISAALGSKTFTDGVFDCVDGSFPSTTGDPCEAVYVFVDTGNAATSNLICYYDTASGLPVTLGGNVTVSWHASGLFAL
jgi:hypothetical protein